MTDTITITSTMASTSRVPGPLQAAMSRLEGWRAVDPLTRRISGIAERVGGGSRGPLLRGEWLGHALHPLATDFPLGCWLAAGFLDVTGWRRDRAAAQRLVGIGLLCSLPTALTGLAEYAEVRERRSRRVGAVHAIGNVGVLGCYTASWMARRRGHHVRGVMLAMLGGCGAWATGYLGGHLSFARNVGSGERGMSLDPERANTKDADVFAERLQDREAQEALLASGAETVWVTGNERGLEGPNSL